MAGIRGIEREDRDPVPADPVRPIVRQAARANRLAGARSGPAVTTCYGNLAGRLSPPLEGRGFFPVQTIRVATRGIGVKIACVLHDTKNDTQAIEVEVLEVDGITVPPRPEVEDAPRQDAPWRHWQGQITRLDSRWWPLWVILGVFAVGLLLTVGLVIGVIYLFLRALAALGRAIFG